MYSALLGRAVRRPSLQHVISCSHSPAASYTLWSRIPAAPPVAQSATTTSPHTAPVTSGGTATVAAATPTSASPSPVTRLFSSAAQAATAATVNHHDEARHHTRHNNTPTYQSDITEYYSIKGGLLPPTLEDVQATFGSMPDIVEAEQLCRKGQFQQAMPLLRRVIDIALQMRDSLVMVYSRMLLARCYYLNGDLQGERHERHEIVKLIDQLIKENKDSARANEQHDAGSSTGAQSRTPELLSDDVMFKQSMSSYAVNLLRLEDYTQCLNLVSQWNPRLREFGAYDALVRVQAMRGVIHYTQGDKLKAERSFEAMYDVAKEHLPFGDKGLAEGDSQVLLGLMYQYAAHDTNSAHKCFSRAVRVYQRDGVKVAHLDAGGIQVPVLYPLLYLGDESSVKQALDIAEEYLGLTHWVAIDAIRVLANTMRSADPLTAEGLYRTAMSRLENPAPYVASTEHWSVLADVIVDYADLLANMEWNNRSRAPEAEKLIEKLRGVQKLHPSVKPAVRHVIDKPDEKTGLPFTLQANDKPFIPQWFIQRFTA